MRGEIEGSFKRPRQIEHKLQAMKEEIACPNQGSLICHPWQSRIVYKSKQNEDVLVTKSVLPPAVDTASNKPSSSATAATHNPNFTQVQRSAVPTVQDLQGKSPKEAREILYGPGGVFGPKGPFSTPAVRYPGGLEVVPVSVPPQQQQQQQANPPNQSGKAGSSRPLSNRYRH